MERLSIPDLPISNRSNVVYRLDHRQRRGEVKHRMRQLWSHEAWLLRDLVTALLIDVHRRGH